MKGLGILILIVLFLWLVWPVISRWLRKKAMERAEDYLRTSMGMPPRDKKANKKNNQDGFYNNRKRSNPYEQPKRNSEREAIIPKEYAEDVEFTETIEYSSRETTKTGEKITVYQESQISDAEYTEIKTDSRQ